MKTTAIAGFVLSAALLCAAAGWLIAWIVSLIL